MSAAVGKAGRAMSVLAALALILAIIAWTLSSIDLQQRPPPLIDGSAVVLLAASKPDIGPYDNYAVNSENPFIPYNNRVVERERGKYGTKRVAPPPPPDFRPPTQTPVVILPPQPPLVWPSLDGSDPSAPACVGLIEVAGHAPVVLVRAPGEKEAKPVAVGEAISGWTLLSITADSIVSFRDPAGSTHQMTILLAKADGDAADGKDAGKDDKKKPPKNPKTAGKKPASGDSGAGGVDDLKKLAGQLSPAQIEAMLNRPDRDQLLKQLNQRFGTNLTLQQLKDLVAQPDAPKPPGKPKR